MASLKSLSAGLLAAFVLWGVMFSPLTAPLLPFWPVMTLAALTLTGFASACAPPWWRRLCFSPGNLAMGVGIAAGLWLVFWVGDAAAGFLFHFAPTQVQAIYGIREGVSPWALTLLLVLLIGPAEEIFWRGYVQEQLSRRLGANAGFVVATAFYAAVHVVSCNFMLVMAALVAGGVWGLCYRFFPDRFTAIIISHALWDSAVFIWFPIA